MYPKPLRNGTLWNKLNGSGDIPGATGIPVTGRQSIYSTVVDQHLTSLKMLD